MVRFTQLVAIAVVVLAVLAACNEVGDDEPDSGNTNGGQATIEPGDGDETTSSTDPQSALVEVNSIGLVRLTEPATAWNDALTEGELVLHNDCVALKSDYEDSVSGVIWPYGFELEADGSTLNLLNEEGAVVARVGDRVSLGGSTAANPTDVVGDEAIERCGDQDYWMASPDITSYGMDGDPEPAINAGETVYFPQWSDDVPAGGRGGGELVLENGCIKAGSHVVVWPPDYDVTLQDDTVVIVDASGEEVAREGDQVELSGAGGFFDLAEYGIPGECGGPHWIAREVEMTLTAGEERPDPTVQDEGDALDADAEMYAEQHNVSLDEAKRRLSLQTKIGPIQEPLRKQNPDSYAGLYIQHEPEFAVIVLMTEGDRETVIKHVDDDEVAELIQVKIVDASLQELEAAHAEVMDLMQELDMMAHSGLDVKGNRVELMVTGADAVRAELERRGVRLPDHVDIVELER